MDILLHRKQTQNQRLSGRVNDGVGVGGHSDRKPRAGDQWKFRPFGMTRTLRGWRRSEGWVDSGTGRATSSARARGEATGQNMTYAESFKRIILR